MRRAGLSIQRTDPDNNIGRASGRAARHRRPAGDEVLQ